MNPQNSAVLVNRCLKDCNCEGCVILMGGEFRLSTRGLARASAVAVERDFEFVIGDKKFAMNRFAADFVSPAVARLHGSDPLCSSFEIEVDDDPEKFELIVSLANGEDIEITLNNAYFLSRVAEKLENTEIVTSVFKMTAERELELDNAVDWLKEKVKFGVDPIEEVTFIAQNFWAMPRENLEGIPPELFAEIINSPVLMIEDENQLLDTIIHMSRSKGSEYRRLLSLLHFEFLDVVGMRKFLEFVEFGDLDGALWEAVSLRLSMGITYLDNVEQENLVVFPRVRIGCCPREDNAIFFESARNLWNSAFASYKSGVAPTQVFLSTLAELLRFETQPLTNAIDVLRSIFPSKLNGTLGFTDLCRLLAMFGPANSVMTKISQLFAESSHEKWLAFGNISGIQGKYGCFNVREMNCLELYDGNGAVRRVWNLPQVESGQGDFLIDEDATMYESWVDYFGEVPF